MSFIPHSIAWAKGEMFESAMMGIGGVLLLVVVLVFWRIGQTPAAKAMILPLSLIGVLLVGAAVSGYRSNQARVRAYEAVAPDQIAEHVQREKAMVEGFAPIYRGTLIFASVCFCGGLAVFWFTLHPHARAWACAVVLLGLAGLVIDFFSKERADIYYGQILAELGETSKP